MSWRRSVDVLIDQGTQNHQESGVLILSLHVSLKISTRNMQKTYQYSPTCMIPSGLLIGKRRPKTNLLVIALRGLNRTNGFEVPRN